MADLINEKEYKEVIDSGFKTWKWLKKIFGADNTEDNKFAETLIKEASNKSKEIDSKYSNDQEIINKQQGIMNQTIVKADNKINANNNEDKLNGHYEENKNEFIDNLINTTSLRKEYILNVDSHDITKDAKNSKDNFANDLINTVALRDDYLLEHNSKDNSSNISKNINDENLNYFGKKAIELKHSPQSKESFKREFMEYVKKYMNVSEMKILAGVFNMKSPPSKLNKEHKEFLKGCFTLMKANPNYELLDNSYKALLKASNKEHIGTQSIRDFISLMNNPKDKLDASLKKDCLNKCVTNILHINKNLPNKQNQN